MSCPQPASAHAHLPRKHTCKQSPSRSTPAPPPPEADPPDQIWLIRLRHDTRSVITTIGLSHTSAEHLAQRITDLLAEPKTGLDKT